MHSLWLSLGISPSLTILPFLLLDVGLWALPRAICSAHPALGQVSLSGFWLGFEPTTTPMLYTMLCVFLLGVHCGISLGRGPRWVGILLSSSSLSYLACPTADTASRGLSDLLLLLTTLPQALHPHGYPACLRSTTCRASFGLPSLAHAPDSLRCTVSVRDL